jgi:dihydroxyacetone kinase
MIYVYFQLYSLFFTACARPCLGDDWDIGTVLRCGIEALCKYGGAEPGDRTMVNMKEQL